MSDLISRQALCEYALNQKDKSVTPNDIMRFPSAEPKRGKWRHYEGVLTCMECGAEFYDDIMEYTGDEVPHFCPDCGANMEG